MSRTKTREKKIEGDGESKDDTKESDCRESRNRSRDSEAPMHIIDRLCHLIRLTLQFLSLEKYRFHATRKISLRHRREPDIEILFKKSTHRVF